MLVKPLQSEKQASPNDVRPSGKEILVKLRQPEKHHFPNEVIPAGKVILVKLLQIEYLLLVDYQCYTL